MSTTMTNNNTTQELQKKAELKSLTLEAIVKECSDKLFSEHSDLRAIAEGLAAGRELDLTMLTGGLCNYSYKVHFKDHEKDKDVALFAKMTFGQPVIHPGMNCPLNRTNCEYQMMDSYSKVSPFPETTVIPYFCIDVEGGEDNMKILATKFAPSNLEEQAGHVFIEGGIVGDEFASNLAAGLGALHNSEVTNRNFNGEMRPFFLALTDLFFSIFDRYVGSGGDEDNESKNKEDKEEESDMASEFAKSLGKGKLDNIVESYRACVLRTDCYIHGDCHPFNILVEGKPKRLGGLIESFQDEVNGNNSRNNDGKYCIIDWEFTHCGPMGKDIGFFSAFPIACLFAHAAQGDAVSSESICEFLTTLWKEYSQVIKLDKKENLSLNDVYRQVLGFSGAFLMGYGADGFHMEYLPVKEDDTAEHILNKVRASLRLLGLKVLNWGFGDEGETLTLEDLQCRFNEAIREEMNRLAPPVALKSRKRRSSILRETGHRVSDSHILFGFSEEFRRTSILSRSCAVSPRKSLVKRASILQAEKVVA